ncbi:ribonuclease H-like domain-containing protein [Tanacetum coccineum]
MAEVLINSLDAGNPLYLQNNDHYNLPIVGFKLTGFENYKMWSTAMKIALKGKNKICFIDGTCVKPVTSVVLPQQWKRCNAIVLGWILSLKQGELFVPKYYYSLNYLLREFDILSLLPACTCVAHEGVLKHNQLVRLMQFLMGLNDVYQPTRSNLLARDPLPDVNEAFVVVSREETHRGLALGKMSAINPTAFVARTNNGNNNFNNNRRANTNNNSNRGPNPNLVCKHCGLIGHTIERCYELNGYHVGFKKNPNLSKQSGFVKKFSGNNVYVSQNASTSSGTMSASFTNEQMMKLLSLINEKHAANVSGSMAGKMPSFFNNSTYFNLHIDKFLCAKSNAYVYNVTLGWIIDSGANQHMTVSTKNILRLTENMVLFDVLVIPEYTDLKLGKIVGAGSESDSLYMFNCNSNGKSFSGLCNFGVVCYVSKELWHCKLSHPANQVLSVLSDKIRFKSGDHVSTCDICHKAKQTREPFPLSDHKSVKMDDLIHLDV